MSPPINPGFGLSDKIQWPHLDRLAVVYVRQSTLQQVSDHQESTRLQYGLVMRAEALGWSSERILTIDEDLGKSGSSAAGRSGFQRLVSEVGLNHVGLILGVEMSRLARSSKDWHQLLEICTLFGTLIADLDGIYDPSQYNDRLLLGLKGTMSEAELHILKQQMMQGWAMPTTNPRIKPTIFKVKFSPLLLNTSFSRRSRLPWPTCSQSSTPPPRR